MLSKLKQAIVKWLGLEFRLEQLQKELELSYRKCAEAKEEALDARIHAKKAKEHFERLTKYLHVGVDVQERTDNSSFAIVFVAGKSELIKFISFENNHQTAEFVKLLKESYPVVDCAHNFKNYIRRFG